ncbi:Lrp/AsnC family transcriptional regulator [Paracoccaceae bacterium GXU_MW_L88]
MQIDSSDRHILRLLQADAGRSNQDLAAETGLSAAQIWRRIEKMERAGVIAGREITLSPAALGYPLEVSLRITLDKTRPRAFDEFLAAARAVPQVDMIQTLLGSVDLRLSVRARDLADYQRIYREEILSLPHLAEVEALMSVADVKRSEALPL